MVAVKWLAVLQTTIIFIEVMKCMSLSLRINRKISPCKNRQNKIKSDKFKARRQNLLPSRLATKRNICYCKLRNCEYYPNDIQNGVCYWRLVFYGETEGNKILEGIRRKLKNNVRLGLKWNRLEGLGLKWFVSGNRQVTGFANAVKLFGSLRTRRISCLLETRSFLRMIFPFKLLI